MEKKVKKTHWNDIKAILKTYTIVIVPITIISILIFSYLSKVEIEKTKELIIGEQNQKSKIINYIIGDFFEEINEDLLVIKNSNEMYDYINQENTDGLYEIEKLFLRMEKNKNNIDQIRFINSLGKEVIRADNDEKGAKLTDYNELQFKNDKEYYIETSKLKNGEIFISHMDLNMENGEIEVPYKPMIRIATPLYSSDDVYQGILIVNYLGQDVLRVFSEQFVDSEYIFVKPSLINNDGYYLYNTNQTKNFGFMFQDKADITLATENVELWNEMKTRGVGYFEKGSEVNFFMEIRPLEGINTTINSDYCWFIVSKFNLKDLPIVQENIIFGMKFSDILVLIEIALLILAIVIIYYYSQKDKEKLSITMRIAENTNDAVVITDRDTNIIYVNNAFEKTTGYKKLDVLGLKTNYFKSGKQNISFYQEMWKSINSMGLWQGELWDKKKDGIFYPKKLNIFAIKNKKGENVDNYIGIFTDLTKVKEDQKYVSKLKNYNMETDLPNEKLLIRLIDKSISSNQEKFSIICFSILNYSNIILKTKEDNQYFLNVLIDSIKSMLDKEDFIAQISRDNFVLGLAAYNNKEDIENFLQKFFRKNKKSFYIKGEELFFDIKAGVSRYPMDGTTPNDLITNAYIALENALEEKEKTHLYYEPFLKDKIEKEIEMNILLRKAISNNELSVHYQPQVEIDEGKIVGAEALIRWKNEKLGDVSPVNFIPLAEKTGQIIEIGYWLIEEIFKDYSSIKDKLSSDFRISINISPLQFKDEKLLPKFEELAKKYEIDFKNFEIEITESVFMSDISSVNEKLHKFRELGMTVAIDDFGTGFSSLSYLKNLKIDKLKIDRSFIKDYPEKDSGEMAKVITNMANELKLKVITEGAENKNQVDYLKSIDCNLIQGFYYSRPLTKDNFYKYLNK